LCHSPKVFSMALQSPFQHLSKHPFPSLFHGAGSY
jgi:hypothetical protein